MPLQVRLIAVSIAVICFFSIAIVGWLSGLSPFTCCKRATIAALITYLVTAWAVKIINVILVNSMITTRMNKQKERDRVSKD